MNQTQAIFFIFLRVLGASMAKESETGYIFYLLDLKK